MASCLIFETDEQIDASTCLVQCTVEGLTFFHRLGPRLFLRGSFFGEFEFWAFGEILNVIAEEVRTWQCLASNTGLATGRCDGRQNRCTAQNKA